MEELTGLMMQNTCNLRVATRRYLSDKISPTRRQERMASRVRVEKSFLGNLSLQFQPWIDVVNLNSKHKILDSRHKPINPS